MVHLVSEDSLAHQDHVVNVDPKDHQEELGQ